MNAQEAIAQQFAEASQRAAYYSGRASALAEAQQLLSSGQVFAGVQQVQSSERVFGFAQALKGGK